MSKMLSSWKEIAQFFGKGVRTVQRWEKTLALPIHRPPGAPSNVVLARTSDLEEWMHQGPAARAIAAEPSVVENSHDLMAAVNRLEGEIRELQAALGAEPGLPAGPQETSGAPFERVRKAAETIHTLRSVDQEHPSTPQMFVQRLAWPAILLNAQQQPLQTNLPLSSLLKGESTVEGVASLLDDETVKAAGQALRKNMPTSLWHKQVFVDGRRSAFDLHMMPLTIESGEVGILLLFAPMQAHPTSLAA